MNNKGLAIPELLDLAVAWATQPTDYDEDTETQIHDGMKLLAVMAKHGLVVRDDLPARVHQLFDYYVAQLVAGGLRRLNGVS